MCVCVSVLPSSLPFVAPCQDESLRYSLERKTFGVPIIGHQAVSFMLADMKMGIEASRWLTLRSAWELDQGRRPTFFASMAKGFAADHAMKCATDAVQIFGGNGMPCFALVCVSVSVSVCVCA